jgi:hypothetical protein
MKYILSAIVAVFTFSACHTTGSSTCPHGKGDSCCAKKPDTCCDTTAKKHKH